MRDDEFARLVSLACHDLRTPLATVTAAAKLLVRQGGLAGREAQLAGLVDGAAGELAALVDQLALAARIAAGRFAPALEEADSLALATGSDPRVQASGQGASLRTDPGVAAAALAQLADAALRHGGGESVAWRVEGTRLRLTPLGATAGTLLERSAPRDLRARVAVLVLESLGARLTLEPDALRVDFA